MKRILLGLVLCFCYFQIFSQNGPCGAGIGTNVFYETFDEADQSTSGTDANGIAWSVTCPSCSGGQTTGDHLWVENGGLEGQDTNGPASFNVTGLDLTGCDVISFSFDYSSVGYSGTGNLECVDECGGCAGDINDPIAGGCDTCWDFLYAELDFGGGITNNTILLGDDCSVPNNGSTVQAICGANLPDGTPIPPASLTSVDLSIVMSMWASTENMTIDNVLLVCYDSAEAAACADAAVSGACSVEANCTASLTAGSVACDAETAGTDTYTATFSYTNGTETEALSVLASAGTASVSSISADGTITVTGIPEGTDITLTLSNTNCMLSEMLVSPDCIPVAGCPVTCTGGTLINQQSFNSNSDLTATGGTAFFNDGSSDHFSVTDGTNISGGYSGFCGSFFAAEDVDDDGGSGTLPATFSYTVDVSCWENMTFTGLFASSEGGFDSADDVTVVAILDGGAPQTLIDVDGQGTGFNVGAAIAGTNLSSSSQSFSATIAGAGSTSSTLVIEVSVSLGSGSETIAFDEFTICGSMVANCGGCPDFSSISEGDLDVQVVESTCTTPGGTVGQDTPGSIDPPTTMCPAGSSLQYSLDGTTWSASIPSYDDDQSITIQTRCNCDSDMSMSSTISSVITVPGECPPPISLPICPASNVQVTTAATNDCNLYEITTVTHDHPDPASVAGTTYNIFIGGESFGPFTYAASNPQSAGPLSSSAFVGDGTANIQVSVGNVVVNEVHADPDGSTGDANGDGVVDGGDDEFIEIINYTCGVVDISGWSIYDAGCSDISSVHLFPGDIGTATTTLNPGQAAVIFGGGTPTGAVLASGALVSVSSNGGLGLNNSGDDVCIKDVCGNSVNNQAYGSEGGSNQSLTLDPDFTGNLVQHNSSTFGSSLDFSPGYMQDGSTTFGYSGACSSCGSFTAPTISAPTDADVIISEIQTDPGSGDASAGEWIELLCVTGTCDISGYYVSNGEFLVVIPDGTVLTAGTYYTIGSNLAANGMVGDILNHDLSANGGYSHDLDVSSCASCNCTEGIWEDGTQCSSPTLISDITLDNPAEQLAIFNPCDLSDPVHAVVWGGGEGLPINKSIPESCGGRSCPSASSIVFPAASDASFYDSTFDLGNETACSTSYSWDGSTYVLDDTPTPGLANDALAYQLTINGVTFDIGSLTQLEDEELAIENALGGSGGMITICDGDMLSVSFTQIDNQTLAPTMGMLISGTNSTGPAMVAGYGSGISFGSSTSVSTLASGFTQTITAANDGEQLYIRIVELGYQTSTTGNGIDYLGGDCSAYDNGETGMSSDCIFELALDIEVVEPMTIAIDDAGCPDNPFVVNVTTGTGPFTVTGTDDDASNIALSLADNISGLTAGSTYTITVADANGCTTESMFTVPADCTSAILPVELLDFDVQKRDNVALVKWVTSNEINSKNFEIERSSNSIDFETIHIAEAQGNSTEKIDYLYIDKSPNQGVNYYRLKQVDQDGAYEYSEIRSVLFDKGGKSFYVVPNVTSGSISVFFDQETLDIDIISIHGQYLRTHSVSSGSEIEMSDLPKGIYLLRTIQDGEALVKRVIKQ